MIREIRSHPKVVLGIFAFCCAMFVGEIFIRYWLYPREIRTETVEEGPTVVRLLGKNLEFPEYKKKAHNIDSYYGNFYKMYGLDDNNPGYNSFINNMTINDFVNDVVLKDIAKKIGITIEDDEKKDVIYGDNIDENIKNDFKDKNGNFDRNKYDAYLKKMTSNSQMKSYWADIEKNIFENRVKNKVNNILKNTNFVNSLEIKRKWKEKNKTIDVDFVALLKEEKEVNFNENKDKMIKYINDHKHKFESEESYNISYFVNNFSVSKELKDENLKTLEPLINKFTKSKNPLEFAKIKSDSDPNDKYSKRKYSETFTKDNLPEVFKDAKYKYEGLIEVEFAKTVNEYNKIYKIYEVDKSKGFEQYKVAILYKKPVIDDNIREKIKKNIENNLLNVKNDDEFKAFADECGYKSENINLSFFNNNTNFRDNKMLKKEIFLEFEDDKNPRCIPLISNEDSVFVGFMNKFINKGELKTIDDKDVKDELIKVFNKKSSKNDTINILKNDKLLDLKFSDIKNNKKNKDLISGVENNIKFSNEKSDLKNKLLEDIVKNLILLPKNSETKFINSKNHLVKLKILDIKEKEMKLDDKDYISLKKEENKKIKDNYNIVSVADAIYNIEKNNNAYFLI